MDEDRWDRKSEHWERIYRVRRRSPAGQAFTGILLVTIGAIFLFGNLGYLDVRYVFRNFWPVLIILLGVKMLVLNRGYGPGPQGIGLIWVVLGAFFLLNNLSVINVAFRTIWPFFPMAIGAFILWKVFVDTDDQPNAPPDRGEKDDNSSSKIWARVHMSRVQRRSNSQEFKGGDVSTFMGMCEVDLRGAAPAGGEAVIDVSAFMGGMEIRVPADWTVINRMSAFLGGIEDRTEPPKDALKRLILRGSVFMGGVEVRNCMRSYASLRGYRRPVCGRAPSPVFCRDRAVPSCRRVQLSVHHIRSLPAGREESAGTSGSRA